MWKESDRKLFVFCIKINVILTGRPEKSVFVLSKFIQTEFAAIFFYSFPLFGIIKPSKGQ